MLPRLITFTGADDRTDVGAMVALADDYPGRVEWGILVASGRRSVPRYPSIAWVREVLRHGPHAGPLRLSLHLCGAYARGVCDEADANAHERLFLESPLGFARVQVNHSLPDIYRAVTWARKFGYFRLILQCRGTHFPAYNGRDVDWLHDESGGRGVVPVTRPQHPGVGRVGYAGGIGPENVAVTCEYLNRACCRGDVDYWIDMESSVRDEEDRLSVERCREVCRAVYGAPG